MVKHRDVLVDKQATDPKFIAQINAELEAQKKKEEEQKRVEKLKKEAIEKAKAAKKEKEMKAMKDRLKSNLNTKLDVYKKKQE